MKCGHLLKMSTDHSRFSWFAVHSGGPLTSLVIWGSDRAGKSERGRNMRERQECAGMWDRDWECEKEAARECEKEIRKKLEKRKKEVVKK